MSAWVLPEVLTMDQARAASAGIQAALAGEPSPVIDASQLQTLDTAAIAVLMQCRRLAAAAGKTLKVTGAPAKLAQLAKLYGVDALLGLEPAGGPS